MPLPQGPVDPLLQRVVDGVAGQIERANIAKGGGSLNAALIRHQAQSLIDTRNQKRVLWVDDRPEGNLFEIAALNKLQIEVLIARSTDEAMARVAADTEGIDLVISDWERHGEPAQAGLKFLQLLRLTQETMPVVYYHGGFDPKLRETRAKLAKSAGALGEAVFPAELLGLVVKALSC